MKKLSTLILLFLVTSQLTVAQNIKKANQLFEKRAYIDAAALFLEEEEKSQDVLQKLGDCYYFNANMKSAVQWYKFLITEHFEGGTLSPEYLFRYAQALKGIENYKEADKWFKKYNDSESLVSNDNIDTDLFIKELNANIKRPYIIHDISSNTEGSEFAPFIHNDTVYFASTRNGGNTYEWNNLSYLDLYQASIDSIGDITNVSPLGPEINTKVHESNAAITKDGQTMYFTRNNFSTGKKKKDANKISHLKIYKAELLDSIWGNVTELPFNSDSFSVVHPALNADESKLYFASDMPGTIGSFDLFVVDINENGTFGTPKNLGSKINTTKREQFPFISSTENLYFASDGHLGLGGLDIFKSKISEETFSSPINMSNVINSNMDDFALIIDEERQTGYFSSNRSGGKGNDDIYRFTQTPEPFAKGIAKDKLTSSPLPGTEVILYDSSGQEVERSTVGKNGTFSFEVEPNSNYTLKGNLKAYNPAEVNFTTDKYAQAIVNLDLLLESYEKAEEKIIVEYGKLQIKIDPIFFYFNSWDIIPAAKPNLEEVVRVMKKYPDMIIEIGTHTDSRGDDDFNLELSHKRANSVRDYLVTKGVNPDNLKSVGYGETQLLNRCDDGVRCWESEHFKNRRCEFVILN
ncbi:OmpA family protein [Urechidicola vernalis]|uniref:OmpA family protein n=1 Tax=Urechidicola vernalis TaxID=3075600 RepID=A0ABU2Y3G2_9FLAO|nr:OmpA family protein [Urechidicola sp. P050]MDT0552742.1 OmpA family protein [Urechidicola sp. P050]